MKEPKITVKELSSKQWRLSNLYRITNDNNQIIPFRPNPPQVKLFNNLWYRNIILKARKIGFSTFVDLYILDECLFNDNIEAAIVADNMAHAQSIFRRTIKFAYDHLPVSIKQGRPLLTKSKTELSFPNGSIVSVGVSMRSTTPSLLHLCLSGDTKILIKNGYVKPIREIKEGNLVLTSTGAYQKVKMLVKNRLEDIGQKLYAVHAFGNYEPLKITENHKVLTREFQTRNPIWKKTKDLKKGDYIAFPTRRLGMAMRYNSLPFPYTGSKCFRDYTGDRISLDNDLGRLIGLYLSEGHRRGSCLTFAFNRPDIEKGEQLIKKFEKYYNSYRIYHSKTSQTSTITVCGRKFADFIAVYFGEGENKYIPDSVWNYGRPFADGLIKAYFDGDGCYTSIGQITATSIRRQILDQMKLLLISLRFGYPSIYYRKAGNYYGRNCKDVWVLALMGDGNWKFRRYFKLPMPTLNVKRQINIISLHPNWCPSKRKFWRRGKEHYWARITKVEEIPNEEFVYDLALEKDPHNYVTVNGVVSNSEFASVCLKAPDKAREVVTGTLQSVEASGDQMVWIESTAAGRMGYFFEYCQRAEKQRNRNLTKLDFKFFFFPWWDHPGHVLNTPMPIPKEIDEYFKQLVRDLKWKTQFSIEQKRWYTKQVEFLGPDIKCEHPSTSAEAFEVILEGAFFIKQFMKIRDERRICDVPINPHVPVDTAWDLGYRDATSIWFYQTVGEEIHLIDFYENSEQNLEFYVNVLRERKYKYGRHYAPHDIRVHELGSGKSRLETASELGLNFKTIERVDSKADSIESARNILKCCWFDEVKCAEGVNHLELYRKQWNSNYGVWEKQPLHDMHSNAADSFQCLAMGHGFHSQKIQLNIGSIESWTV